MNKTTTNESTFIHTFPTPTSTTLMLLRTMPPTSKRLIWRATWLASEGSKGIPGTRETRRPNAPLIRSGVAVDNFEHEDGETGAHVSVGIEVGYSRSPRKSKSKFVAD